MIFYFDTSKLKENVHVFLQRWDINNQNTANLILDWIYMSWDFSLKIPRSSSHNHRTIYEKEEKNLSLLDYSLDIGDKQLPVWNK